MLTNTGDIFLWPPHAIGAPFFSDSVFLHLVFTVYLASRVLLMSGAWEFNNVASGS